VRKEAERQRKEAERIAAQFARGREMTGLLRQMDFVDEQFDETTTSMATNGMATVLLYEHGTWCGCSLGSLPSSLLKALKRSERRSSDSKPTYVALGSKNRYYVEFDDGSSLWYGPDSLTEALKESDQSVASVAFGSTWTSYFVVFDNGGWNYGGIPDGLSDLIRRRNRRADLVSVALGPDGEWFLRARNGKCWWNGTSHAFDKFAYKRSPMFVDFGCNDTYIIRYNE